MITASNLSSPPVYQPPKEQGNQKRKIQRDSRKPPLKKKHTRRTIAEMPSQGIRKVNGKLWDKTNCRGTQVKESER
jgi:hypothetical protein